MSCGSSLPRLAQVPQLGGDDLLYDGHTCALFDGDLDEVWRCSAGICVYCPGAADVEVRQRQTVEHAVRVLDGVVVSDEGHATR
jgi:hypothetical protein